jgi:hypothetical protein
MDVKQKQRSGREGFSSQCNAGLFVASRICLALPVVNPRGSGVGSLFGRGQGQGGMELVRADWPEEHSCRQAIVDPGAPFM